MSKLNTLLLRECLSDEEREKIKKYWRGNVPTDAVLGSHILWYGLIFRETEECGKYWLEIFDRLRNEELEAMKKLKEFDNTL